MATKIKANTIDAQIECIDQTTKDATGTDLKEFATKVVARREALRKVGIQIVSSIGFNNGSVVLVRGGELTFIIH